MIGTSVSHYQIISHIGAGGMGTVYLAEDTNLKRRVALKFLLPGSVHDPDAAVRLLREARAASASGKMRTDGRRCPPTRADADLTGRAWGL
jgi:serine/threonine protein kinase